MSKSQFRIAFEMARRMQRIVFEKQIGDVTEAQFDAFWNLPRDVRNAATDDAMRCLPAAENADLAARLREYKLIKLFGC